MTEWTEQQRRRLYRIALNFFNKHPERGIQLLVQWGFVEEQPRAIARLLMERRGLSKQMIGEYLGNTRQPLNAAVLEHFLREMPMYDMEIDKALRLVLNYFRLPGEAQRIDHIMQAFGKRYRFCNPNRSSLNVSPDTVYILAFAIIMLNTDLHTPSLKDSKRMKLEEFIKNIRGIEEGQLLERPLLQGIYERIREFEFRSGSDHVSQVMKVDQSIIGKDKPKLVEHHRRLICYCRLHQVNDANKKQPLDAHQREIFLFNDLMLVAKVFSRSAVRRSGSGGGAGGQYTLRRWTTLIGLRVEEFQSPLYQHGLVVHCPDGMVLLFNAKNGDDRYRFMCDVRESVLECTEMEQLRLEMELDKQRLFNGGGASGVATKARHAAASTTDDSGRTEAQRDSGLPDLDAQASAAAPPTEAPSSSGSPDDAASAARSSIGKSSNASTASSSTVAVARSNGAVAAVGQVRRLSFNSMDSGMVEEATDFSV